MECKIGEFIHIHKELNKTQWNLHSDFSKSIFNLMYEVLKQPNLSTFHTLSEICFSNSAIGISMLVSR